MNENGENEIENSVLKSHIKNLQKIIELQDRLISSQKKGRNLEWISNGYLRDEYALQDEIFKLKKAMWKRD